MANIGDYETTYERFEWETPERFNFGRDVIDALPEERPAMIWLGTNGEERRLTFGDFSRLSNKFANAAKEMGIERGDRVMVLTGKVPECQVILIGLLKVGAITIPSAAQLRTKDLQFRAENSGAVAIISGPEGAEQADAMRDEVPGLRHFISLGTEREGWESYDTHGYTYAKRMQARFWLDLQADDLLWCTAATGWAKNIWNVFLGPWSHGVEIFMHEGAFDPAERLDLIWRYRPTVLCQAPTEYRVLANAPELESADLSSVRHALSAGEPLNAPVIERWKELHGITIYDGYGQTENTLLVGNFPGLEVRPGSMGKPAPGCDVRIINEDGEELPASERGDIALSTDNPALMKCYWEQPEETEAVMRNGYYLTGDRASRDEDGYVWFEGRSDDVILSASYRIGPFEVEDALIGHPAVAESAVVAKPDEERGNIVKAYVVLTADYEPSEDLVDEIQDHCKNVTAPYKYPRQIEFIDQLPKTASGKIRRVELRERETAGA